MVPTLLGRFAPPGYKESARFITGPLSKGPGFHWTGLSLDPGFSDRISWDRRVAWDERPEPFVTEPVVTESGATEPYATSI
jgi:hypothetical protein